MWGLGVGTGSEGEAMTKEELVFWVAQHYFSGWEIEWAEGVCMESGVRAGRASLVKGCSRRGACGPGKPSYFTRSRGKVECYFAETNFAKAPADVAVTVGRLAKLVLDDPRQPRLF